MTDREFFEALTRFKGGIPEPINETVSVLSYEVGRCMEYAMYMKWHENDAQFIGYRGQLKSELIDVAAQLILLCESIGSPFEEVREMGIRKAVGRFTRTEFKDGGII